MKKSMLILLTCLGVAINAQAQTDLPKKNTEAQIISAESNSIESDIVAERQQVNNVLAALERYQKLSKITKKPELLARIQVRSALLALDAAEANWYLIAGELIEATDPLAEALAPFTFEFAQEQISKVIEDHPDYYELDRLYYQLAHVLDLQGKLEDQLEVLQLSVARFPSSKHLNEQWFRIGELQFSLSQFIDAEKAYLEVVSNTKQGSDFWRRASYKYAWSLYKNNEYQKSTEQLLELLDVTELWKDENLSDDTAVSLRQDIFYLLSLTFSYQDGNESVIALLEQKGIRPYEFQLFNNLGNFYLEGRRYLDAADVFRGYSKRHPGTSEALKMQLQVIEAFKNGGFPSQLLPAKEQLALEFGPGSQFWLKRPLEKKKELAALLTPELIQLAEHYHAAAREKSDPLFRDKAAAYYLQYLETSGGNAQKNYQLAEVYMESGQYLKAAEAFAVSAYDYPTDEKSAESAYAVLVAYQAQIGVKAKQQTEEERHFSLEQETFYALKFADTFASDKRVVPVLLKVAQDQAAENNWDLAIKTSKRVIKLAKPTDKESLQPAWKLVAQAALDNQDYLAAEVGYLQLLELTPRRNKQYINYQNQLTSAVFKQAEIHAQANEIDLAVEDYLRIRKLHPKSSVLVNAEYDAATLLLNNERWQSAIEQLKIFNRRFNGHKFTKNINEKFALAYEKSGQLTLAAQVLGKIAKREGSSQLARESRWHAAELARKQNETQLAIDMYKRFVYDFPAPVAPNMEARKYLADLYAAQKDDYRRNFWLKKITVGHKKAASLSTDRTAWLAAWAGYELAEPQFNRFESLRLKLPLERSLARKQKAMEKALKAYGNVVELGVADFATAATYRIAELYRLLGKGLLDSERPKDLDADTLEEYVLLLEDEAFPLEEQAIELHLTNAQRASQGVYDQWVKKSYLALGDLQPGRYQRGEKHDGFLLPAHF
ncbi:tetratricopeptide repeat protein [Pelagibaculum spongiae]|uniref:Tetratricopeptide repeat protein n=1 Tax=Pelagibaculum spongiae TaxID=2080658 RepID=A0A2V1GMY2_9GAMM|nr:tetratricopeptide repeat protein [Pelagibaculum spongiae]PVZ62977.1 hypothetical protein DC094_21665 [Pelagibaculum spongiae]